MLVMGRPPELAGSVLSVTGTEAFQAGLALISLLASLYLNYRAWFGRVSMRVPIEADREESEEPPSPTGQEFTRRVVFLWLWRLLLLALLAGSLWLAIEVLVSPGQ
jgi:hypothetical protein